MKTFSNLMISIALAVILSLPLFAKEAIAQSYVVDYYGDTYYQEPVDPESYVEEPQFEYIPAPDTPVIEPPPTEPYLTRVQAPVSPVAFFDEMAKIDRMTIDLWDAMRNISRERGGYKPYDPNVGSDLFTVVEYVNAQKLPQLSGAELYDVIGSAYWQMNDYAANGVSLSPSGEVAILLSNTERVLNNR